MATKKRNERQVGGTPGSAHPVSGDRWLAQEAGARDTLPSLLDAPPSIAPKRTLVDDLRTSEGFYSRVVPAIEAVDIPPPPRLPSLAPDAPAEAFLSDGDVPSTSAFDTLPPETLRGVDLSHLQSTFPKTDSDGERPTPAGASSVFVPPLLRRLADEWRQTGTLRLPETSSPRHARALQRALLLGMIQGNDYASLPEGLQQRAAWMFREGWGQGKKERDADDLCFVLGLPQGPESRDAVIDAAWTHLPADAILPPSSPRWSSRPPRSR